MGYFIRSYVGISSRAWFKNNFHHISQAYAKFCKVPLRIKATNNPFRSPNGQLPVLKHENGTENTVSDILKFFRKNNYCLDFGLDPKQCAEVNAYESMLKENIFPALQFIWYQVNCLKNPLDNRI